VTIRTLIVDDEEPARRRLVTMLGDHTGFEVIGECANGPEAVEEIASQEPDLLFLDVQMPEMNGFEVVDAVGPDAVRSLVFVTAYDQYALQAFDARAIDYLLKPFTAVRFSETLDRVRRVLAGEAALDVQQRIGGVLEDVLPPLRERRIAARDGSRVVFVRVADVDWISGARNYVELHSQGRTLIVRATLKATATRLAAAGFQRISHSVIVNSDRIRAIERDQDSGFSIMMESGETLQTSTGYESELRDLLRLFP
jgi:two-component system, LytTR family, response regulator